jgi:diguanylate cyclase (GGDEF)-like protein
VRLFHNKHALKNKYNKNWSNKVNDLQKIFEKIIKSLSVPAFAIDKNHKVIFWNTACEELTGVLAPEVLGTSNHWKGFYAEERPCMVDLIVNGKQHQISECYQSNSDLKSPTIGAYRYENWLLTKKGSKFIAFEANGIFDDQGELIGGFEVLFDLTGYKEHLNFLAHYDYLTKLPNRSYLEEKVDITIKNCEKDKKKCAVLFLDLDKFKHVNDNLGHDAGDVLLKEVAIRLQKSVRNVDTVARQGGDEFVILLDNIKDKEELHIIARKILSSFSKPFNVKGQEISIGASMGIAIYPDNGTSAQELLKNADSSMYWNKSHVHKNQSSSIFNEDINKKLNEDLSIISKLNTAIPHQLEVYFQPQYCSKTKEIFGAEALVRWYDSELGWIRPDKFIPLAEERGMLKPLWEFVLDASCKVIKETQIKVSVNLSPTQLLDEGIVEHVEKSINKYQIDPSLLTLEITEASFMSNFDYAKDTLIKLKNLGTKLALDDFGTGYSALSYLNQLPLDYLKIDKSFIQDESNMSIVTSIVEMADKLHLSTIAEGIETLEQLMLLKYSGCSIIQGFYYSKPLDIKSYLAFIKSSYDEEVELLYKNNSIEIKNVAIEIIKHRYAGLMNKLDSLEDSIQKDSSEQNIRYELKLLYDLILSSITEEEELLLKDNDPNYKQHKLDHEGLVEKYVIYSKNILEKKTNIEPLISFIRRWLVGHLLINQAPY